MSVLGLYNHLKKTSKQVHEEISELEKPSKQEALKGFFSRVGYAYKLVLLEKEIITFAILQVLFIAAGYFLFIQVFQFIPDEVWQSAREHGEDGSTVADLVITVWGFVCVGIVAFPLGVLSGCTGAAHFLHRSKQPVTIKACLSVTLPRAWPIWLLTWMDSWITVNRILDRLPKKNDRRTLAEKLLAEAMYYAWKVLTMGILPALLTGHSPWQATKQIFPLLKAKYKAMLALRFGYSLCCWVVGIASYILGLFVLYQAGPGIKDLPESQEMLIVMYYVAVPIIIAASVIQVFIRPIYLISMCDIYCDYLQEQGKPATVQQGSPSLTAIFGFILLCTMAWLGYALSDELGITAMLATPYQ